METAETVSMVYIVPHHATLIVPALYARKTQVVVCRVKMASMGKTASNVAMATANQIFAIGARDIVLAIVL